MRGGASEASATGWNRTTPPGFGDPGRIRARRPRRRVEPTEGFEPSSLPYRGSMSDQDHQVGVSSCRRVVSCRRGREDRTLRGSRVRTARPPGRWPRGAGVARCRRALARSRTGLITGCSRVPRCSATSARASPPRGSAVGAWWTWGDSNPRRRCARATSFRWKTGPERERNGNGTGTDRERIGNGSGSGSSGSDGNRTRLRVIDSHPTSPDVPGASVAAPTGIEPAWK